MHVPESITGDKSDDDEPPIPVHAAAPSKSRMDPAFRDAVDNLLEHIAVEMRRGWTATTNDSASNAVMEIVEAMDPH